MTRVRRSVRVSVASLVMPAWPRRVATIVVSVSGSELEGVVERELMSSTCQPGGLKLKEIVGDLVSSSGKN